MSLRVKCALLLVAFELTLGVTLIITVRSIGIYFDEAARSISLSSTAVTETTRLRSLLRTELTYFLQFMPHPAARKECLRLEQEIAAATNALRSGDTAPLTPAEAGEFRQMADARRQHVADYLDAAGAAAAAVPRFDPGPHLAIDAFLGRIESRLMDNVRASVDSTFEAQHRAAFILSANMIVGVLLSLTGLLLVRRWVLLPLAELKQVTDEIGKGNLDYRARVHSQDELGQLAAAVNQMSADLARIERQLIQRERLAAMGELIAHVAHNIRNPLAGIRSLADASRREISVDSHFRKQQEQIVASIDKFERWLRELEHTCSPLEVRPEPTDIAVIVDNVVDVFRPMSERRGVAVQWTGSPDLPALPVDARHFEQALAAVVGNAIEAVGDRGRVTIAADANGDPDQWTLSVTDNGSGVPVEIRQRIFEPSFSTKRTGHGLGLALARKVVELHGGQLTVECPEEGGSIFRFLMPRLPIASVVHG